VGFSADIEAFAKKAGLSVNQTIVSVALELFGSVIKDTPADTGRARGNWQCSIGSPKGGVLSGDSESETETPAPNGDGPKTAAAIQDVRNVALKLLPDQTIFLTNNLPYIRRLEYDGWSSQSPAGMVRKNVARIQQIVAKEAKANKI
jgi:hypothetical protein